MKNGTLRVVLIYRKRREGAYSIEELFHTIAGELRKTVEVIEFETGTRWDTFRDIWRLKKLNADVYHVTGDINYFVPFLPHKKTVLTVHDIGHYLFGLKGVKRWVYKWLWLKLPISAARFVTTVSRETQDNIVKYLGVSSKKTITIENCYNPLFQNVCRPFNSTCPVILQVGTKPYKNVPRLIEALKGIKCRLILVGKLDEKLAQHLVDYEVDYVNYTNLTHEEIVQQYSDCDIVSFVSIGEGFGVPIIEAQASGRPIITSAISPMREVAGDGACLVDPLNTSQIREGIFKIIENADFRNEIVKQGLKNVTRYSPVNISEHYFDLYRRIS